MIPLFPKFKKIDIKDKNLIDYALEIHPKYISEICFNSIFIWNHYRQAEFTMINDNICILVQPANGLPSGFYEPIGKRKIYHTCRTCLDHTGLISCVSAGTTYSILHRCFSHTPLREHYDYIYLTKNLANLSGRKFDGKRNHIKRFTKIYPNYKFVPLTKDHRKQVIEIYKSWFKNKHKNQKHIFRDTNYDLNDDLTGLDRAMAYANKLGLLGGGIFVGNKMLGLIIGSRMNKKMATIHFMHALPNIPSIYQTLLWEACNNLLGDFKYTNLEQDLGLPGLRKSKLSYQPIRLEEKFDIKFLVY